MTHQANSGEGSNGTRKVRRTAQACDACNRRKVKCSGGQPCVGCVKHSTTCTYERVSKKRGPPRGYLGKILERLQQLEAKAQTFSDDPAPASVSGVPSLDILFPQQMTSTDTTQVHYPITTAPVTNGLAAALSLSPSGTGISESSTRSDSSLAQGPTFGDDDFMKYLTLPDLDNQFLLDAAATPDLTQILSPVPPNISFNSVEYTLMQQFLNWVVDRIPFFTREWCTQHWLTFPPLLRNGISACALTFPSPTGAPTFKAGEFYYEEAKKHIAEMFENPSPYSVLGAAILSLYAAGSGRGNACMTYLGMAVRVAQQLRLDDPNAEPRNIDTDVFDMGMRIRIFMVLNEIDFYSAFGANIPFLIPPDGVNTTLKFMEQMSETDERYRNAMGSSSIFFYLTSLLTLGRRIVDFVRKWPKEEYIPPIVYQRQTELDQELQLWYANLPTWIASAPVASYTVDPVSSCPPSWRSLFLVALYHLLRIILHEFAMVDSIELFDTVSSPSSMSEAQSEESKGADPSDDDESVFNSAASAVTSLSLNENSHHHLKSLEIAMASANAISNLLDKVIADNISLFGIPPFFHKCLFHGAVTHILSMKTMKDPSRIQDTVKNVHTHMHVLTLMGNVHVCALHEAKLLQSLAISTPAQLKSSKCPRV